MELINVFEEIFSSLDNGSEEQANKNVSGQKEFDCPLDSNGDYTGSFSKNGYGQTVNCILWFTSPDNTTFTVTITSNNGAGIPPFTIVTNQKSSKFVIKTKMFGATTVNYKVHATASNVTAHGVLEYWT